MKISFIGAGRVGSAAVFSVIHAIDSIDEIVMVDIKEDIAKGEALDLTHAAYAMERSELKIIGTSDYSKTKNSDVFVVTAGLARKPGQTREELAKTNYKIIKSIAENIKENVKEAIIITATNPMDAMNYTMWKETGFPREKIIGMGGVLDTARMHSIGIDGFVVGSHGIEMVPTEEVTPQQLEDIRGISLSVIKKKGGTVYGPAVALNRMVYAIANDTNEVLPCSCILEGEYETKEVSIGVPARIGKMGIEEIMEIEALEGFSKSVESIKQQIKAINL